jgi:hypothetical protein
MPPLITDEQKDDLAARRRRKEAREAAAARNSKVSASLPSEVAQTSHPERHRRERWHRGNGDERGIGERIDRDAFHRPGHRPQVAEHAQLVDTRKHAFEARTGREMTDENIWLAERRKEQQALGKIIAAIADPRAEAQAVRGAGAHKHR